MKIDQLAGNDHTSGHNHSTGNNLENNSSKKCGQNNGEQVVVAQILHEDSGQGWKGKTCI